MTRLQVSNEKSQRENHRLGRRLTWLEIVAALLAIATASLGIWSSTLNSDIAHLNATIDTLNRDVATAQEQLNVRQEEIESLRHENGELRAALPRSIAPEEVPDARNVGAVTLADGGDAIDLNSTQPTFDTGIDTSTSDTLSYRDGELRTSWHQLDILALKNGHKAAYETCAIATGYAPTNTIEPHRLTGEDICIRLKSGNYARIVVQESAPEHVTLEITTWEPPL
ncbi:MULTISPECIES: hypothetical protein [unclassified Microbacterium]|uniref:hypothetical protein n=1 Tax=unclassified Microbacterium TaxID=2609290 RepID=UPI000CFDB42C|nr:MULTISPECIES: hypothetical protein [unclassified Microbacterium]PQZ48520.1 hypothetical protein CQ032_20160 [Microbacterium sp. MYb43]PQZ69243.1 hypothetical protein CQ031_20110 [Microbacterium sp. MYb40]PRB13971.1 hypothetical protein CQ040_20205 [Microbacterium sp. MYb54]PRB20052.1 hypothetical protein CQ037_20105 [Microbacterium sp. MYb50]PRB57799.1 hypothetical protein CQ021_20180 [Microbacterium sp. MYb24]